MSNMTTGDIMTLTSTSVIKTTSALYGIVT